MKKNLYLALALCATFSSSSLVMSMEVAESEQSEVSVSQDQSAAGSVPSKKLPYAQLRVSTYVPHVEKYAGTWTLCVDGVCAAAVAVGLGYAAYSNRSSITRGGNAVVSTAVSVAKATPAVANTVACVALYPVKEVVAHKTAAVTGAGAALAGVAGVVYVFAEDKTK